MKTVLHNSRAQTSVAAQRTDRLAAALLRPVYLTVGVLLVLAALVGSLAYQAPPHGTVQIGWLGDQLFLHTSAGLGGDAITQGAWYPDDLTPDSPTQRSRWSREHAVITLPNLGRGHELALTLVVQGFPADVRDPPQRGVVVASDGTLQPIVTLKVGDAYLAEFHPTATWQSYTFIIPVALQTSPDLVLDLTTSATFQHTLRGDDPRPKGVRLATVAVAPHASPPPGLLPPAWRAVGLLMLVVLLFYLVLLRVFGSYPLAFVTTILATGAGAAGLALARIWMGAVLEVALWGLLGLLLVAWAGPLLGWLHRLLQRYTHGHGLHYGVAVAAGLWLALLSGAAVQRWASPTVGLWHAMFPDSLLIGIVLVGSVMLLIVSGRAGLPHATERIAASMDHPRYARWWLLLFGGAWLAFVFAVILRLPYVGHADYADNAVVARNLIAGRGWVVDYVSQFYYIIPSTTRPQETWPLLQPVWIAPFFALFGAQAWAAKLPNLLFTLALLLLVYHIGARLWSPRVGLLAALITVTNHLFFTLVIYATSDLAFVVFSTAAIYLIYRAEAAHRTAAPARHVYRWLIAAGVLTGLMMLQKPSGALIAVGLGLWLAASRLYTLRLHHPHPTFAQARQAVRGLLVGGLLWTAVALLVLSPYMARNMALFGAPVYSTEKYDAWVLGYRGDSGDAWHDIYRVFAPEVGGLGVPDRSWVLRWGFDYTYAKFRTQLLALRDYLMPAWANPPGPPDAAWHSLFSRNEVRNIMSPAGAWLSLLAVLAAVRFRRRLLSLLLFAFVPYTIFLLTYWRTNEERYFLMVMPWLALLIAWLIWSLYTALSQLGDGRWQPLALLVVLLTTGTIMQHSWGPIATKVQTEPALWQPDLLAYAWLRDNTAPDAVIMTRNPWQLNWHSTRPAVMIPNTNDAELFWQLAQHYRAEYLVFETLQRVKGDGAELLAPLLRAGDAQVGDVIYGFTVVYASPTPDNRVLIYRFPEQLPAQFAERKE